VRFVIPSEARNLSFSVFISKRDSSLRSEWQNIQFFAIC